MLGFLAELGVETGVVGEGVDGVGGQASGEVVGGVAGGAVDYAVDGMEEGGGIGRSGGGVDAAVVHACEVVEEMWVEVAFGAVRGGFGEVLDFVVDVWSGGGGGEGESGGQAKVGEDIVANAFGGCGCNSHNGDGW